MKAYEKDQLLRIISWISKNQSINNRMSLIEDEIDPDKMKELYETIKHIRITRCE